MKVMAMKPCQRRVACIKFKELINHTPKILSVNHYFVDVIVSVFVEESVDVEAAVCDNDVEDVDVFDSKYLAAVLPPTRRA